MVQLPGSRQFAWYRRRSVAVLLLLCAAAASPLAFALPALSQVAPQNLLHFPVRPKQPPPPVTASDAPMLVQADQIKYDYPNNSVAAVGNVQIYFRGATIEADEVVYDQKNKRLLAQGNAKLM